MADMYEAPKVTDLGSLEEMTLQFNKVGPAPDSLSQINPVVVGSFTSIP